MGDIYSKSVAARAAEAEEMRYLRLTTVDQAERQREARVVNAETQATPWPTPQTPGGLRYDDHKDRYDLLPPDALQTLVAVYTSGAVKYAPRNWEKGMAWMRMFASMMRHAWAWARGEDFDKESGHPHMAHVAWGALGLVAYQYRNIGEDDRVKLDKQ